MKIVQARVIQFTSHPNIAYLELETDSGIIGLGESYYSPNTAIACLRETIIPILLDHDPLQIEGFWRRVYDATHVFGNKGVEMRCLAAADVALWDILGQHLGQPITQILGGTSHPNGVMVYNTCASDGYAQGTPGVPRKAWTAGTPQYDDYQAWNTDAGKLAKSLLAMGIRTMKIWPFDPMALVNRGQTISRPEVERGLLPFKQIRDAVGMEMDVILEGHGYWSLAPARRIAQALEPYNLVLLEDLMKPDNLRTLAKLRESTSTPICASELLMNRYAILDLLEADACDVVMADITWAGGMSECRKIANLAEAHNMGVIFHDCTGPVTLAAGLHLGSHTPNTWMQEIVRAYTLGPYRDMVDHAFEVEEGRMRAPTAPGLGVKISAKARQRSDCVVTPLIG